MGELVFEEGDYNATHFTPIYRTVGELISFADLLLRWPFKSFYRVSFFAGLETPFAWCESIQASKRSVYMLRNESNVLPPEGFVRLPVVIRIMGIGKTTWWCGIKAGRFPKPVKLGARTSAWRVEDIRALIADPMKGAADGK